ncbi:hypothetical protein LOK49_LG02G01242 [Camellia lanceoleosa]|uniref:Uncharacterized protein n=1 Tax=Camellia lanceoleosa TaxID=1840588 RepID=A0ACC0IUH4_9ERIC|nr:hypothetical protein LOK49_LG02G01242 [Camellia lanceoleosa]
MEQHLQGWVGEEVDNSSWFAALEEDSAQGKLCFGYTSCLLICAQLVSELLLFTDLCSLGVAIWKLEMHYYLSSEEAFLG